MSVGCWAKSCPGSCQHTHFGEQTCNQEWELITRARLSPLSLPASHGGSRPVSVPGCTYGSRALTKACLGSPGSALPSPHPGRLQPRRAGCPLPSLAGRAEPQGKPGGRVATTRLWLSPAPGGPAPSWWQLLEGDRRGCSSLANGAEQSWGMPWCWDSAG